MDYDTDYSNYWDGYSDEEGNFVSFSGEERRVRQERKRQARYDRWRNGERSEELEREFGRRATSPLPWRPFGSRTPEFVGLGTRSNNVPLEQALWPLNPPVVPNALAPAGPYDGPHPVGAENPSTIRSARRGEAHGGFSVKPLAGFNLAPPVIQPVVKHKSGPVDLSSKFDDARFADFRVLTDSGHFFQVKKALLAVQSPFFAQLFRSEQTELLVPGVEAAVVRAFLLFFYRGQLADVQPHAIAVLALAVNFEVGDLKNDLSEWLAANLQLTDVFRLFSLVERHPEELQVLSEAIFEFARRNATALAQLPAFEAFMEKNPKVLIKLFKLGVKPQRLRRGCSCCDVWYEEVPRGFGPA